MADPIDAMIDAAFEKALNGGTTAEKKRTPYAGYSETELRLLWRAERLSEDDWKAELVARGASEQGARDQIAVQKNSGVSTAAKTKGQLTPGEQSSVDAIKAAVPPPSAEPEKKDIKWWGTRTGEDIQQIADATRDGGTLPTGAQPSGGSQGASSGSTASRGGSGGGSGSSSTGGGSRASGSSAAAPAVPPPPVRNSAADMEARGGIKIGSDYTMEGRRMSRTNRVLQDENSGGWYIVNPAGEPVGGPYKTQTAANAENAFSDIGPGVTSNSGFSNLARYSQSGGAGMTPLGNSLFPTTSMDEMIAAGATKGTQPGEVVATRRYEGNPIEVTAGGKIPEWGGMKQVTDGGNAISYTGQLPGNRSIGMSSPHGRTDTVDQLLSAAGIDTRYNNDAFNKMAADPRKAAQFLETVERQRAAGTLKNFGNLASRYDNDLSGQNIKVSSSNNKFRQAIAELLAEAGIPDLEYFPEPDVEEPLIFAAGTEEEPKSSPFIIGSPSTVYGAPMYKSGWPEPATTPASGQPRLVPLLPGERGPMLDADTQGMPLDPYSAAYQRHAANIRRENPFWNEQQINAAIAQLMEAERLSTAGPQTVEPKFHFWRDDPLLGGGQRAPMSYAERDAEAMGWMNTYGNIRPTGQGAGVGFGGYGGPPSAADNPAQLPFDAYRERGISNRYVMADGGGFVPPEPVGIQGLISGTKYAVAGAQPEMITPSANGVGVTPLPGNNIPQAAQQERALADAWTEPVTPFARLMETMFGPTKKSGRRPAYQMAA